MKHIFCTYFWVKLSENKCRTWLDLYIYIYIYIYIFPFEIDWPFILEWSQRSAKDGLLLSAEKNICFRERKATFTQQQNTVVSPVFESLIWLRSHKVRLFMALTAAFCNRIHTWTFSGLTTAFLEHTRCVNGTDWQHLWFYFGHCRYGYW